MSRPKRPLCPSANWTNEEGSRFQPAMMASAASYVGGFRRRRTWFHAGIAGASPWGKRSNSIGYRGAQRGSEWRKLPHFVELHIGQDQILEAENKTIGVVNSGPQGVLWYDGKITGFESHAGSTPMPLRRDALDDALGNGAGNGELSAKKTQAEGRSSAPSARPSSPTPSRNVIPGEIAFTRGLPQRRRRTSWMR